MADTSQSIFHRRLVGRPLLYGISVFASLGVFLFGYDQGVMSGIITGTYFRKYFDYPGPFEIGTMVAVLEVGAFITSVAAGRIGDMIGEKARWVLVQSYSPLAVQFKPSPSGSGVWLLAALSVALVSAYFQRLYRSTRARFPLLIIVVRWPAWNLLAILSGIRLLSGQITFALFIESDMSWRIPLFIQCVIGAILAAGSLVIPESPRWLIDNDREKEGLRVIADLHGGDLRDPIAVAEYEEIKGKVREGRASGEGRSYRMMWRKYKRRVLLAMSSQAFAQLNGINVISYYAPRVFEEAGWIGRQAILMTGINSVIYVFSTIPTWYLVDHWGRRAILLSGAVVMSAALVATGWWMYIDVPQTANAVVLCVIIFNAGFGYSWGPIPWLYPPEIMPLHVRAKGVSLSTATNWAFNFLVGEMTPYLQDIIGWRLYPMHGFFCICSFILVYFLYPETKGVPLEEMDAVFGEDEREEQLENESEVSSLVQGHLTDPERLHTPRRPLPLERDERGWFARLFRPSIGGAYQPIANG